MLRTPSADLPSLHWVVLALDRLGSVGGRVSTMADVRLGGRVVCELGLSVEKYGRALSGCLASSSSQRLMNSGHSLLALPWWLD